MVRGFILPIVIRLFRRRSNSLRFLYAKLSNGYRVMDRCAWTAYVKYVYHNLLITYRSIAKVGLLQDLGVSQFPPPSNRRRSRIVEVSLQIFRATRWSTNSHQTFTRHQSIILPCNDTKTTPSNSQMFRATTKHYIVRYKERLLRKLALSCSISSTKVLLCLENFIPPATLRSHPRKYRNERVGGSLRQQWSVCQGSARVSERLASFEGFTSAATKDANTQHRWRVSPRLEEGAGRSEPKTR